MSMCRRERWRSEGSEEQADVDSLCCQPMPWLYSTQAAGKGKIWIHDLIGTRVCVHVHGRCYHPGHVNHMLWILQAVLNQPQQKNWSCPSRESLLTCWESWPSLWLHAHENGPWWCGHRRGGSPVLQERGRPSGGREEPTQIPPRLTLALSWSIPVCTQFVTWKHSKGLFWGQPQPQDLYDLRQQQDIQDKFPEGSSIDDATEARGLKPTKILLQWICASKVVCTKGYPRWCTSSTKANEEVMERQERQRSKMFCFLINIYMF